MAGGGGARLWPASVSERPKQLIDPLLEAPVSSYTHSLLSRTVDRITPIASPDDVWVVTGVEQRAGVGEALPSVARDHVLTEPVGRNTAAAIALSAVHLRARVGSEDPTLLVFPADHYVDRLPAFQRCLATACVHAEETHAIVTLGIPPQGPSTSYGYIERGTGIVTAVGAAELEVVYPVLRFVEKPTLEWARHFVDSGRFLWNSGIFVMRLSRIERELATHCPDVWDALRPVAAALARGDRSEATRATDLAYATMRAVPIDVAVMEKTSELRVVPATFEWTDLGSWEALYDLATKDAESNAKIWASREPVLVDARRCLAWSDHAQIAIIGLDDVAVVHSGDRVLVMPRDRAQDVRRVVHELTERERTEP